MLERTTTGVLRCAYLALASHGGGLRLRPRRDVGLMSAWLAPVTAPLPVLFPFGIEAV